MMKKTVKLTFVTIILTLLLTVCMSAPAWATAGPYQAHAAAYFAGLGWTDYAADGAALYAPGTYPVSFRFGLNGQPEGTTGTIQYQVKPFGQGWGGICENGQPAIAPENAASMEAVRIFFNGTLGDYFDIYYSVRVGGQWCEWVKNGEIAGAPDTSTYIEGIKISILLKGEVPPATSVIGGGIDPNRPMIALTFDDGPNGSNTPRILNRLEQVGGRATFFVLGNLVPGREYLLQRMVADGCEIGAHTWNHETLTKLTPDGVASTLNRTCDTIQGACGVRPVSMRPPGGGYNASVLSTVGSLGLSAYYWSIDTRDWEHKNAAKTIDHVLSNVRDGDIVLMHDIWTPTADACDVLIPELANRGYQLVTVSELAAYRAGGAVPGQIYYKFR